MSHKAILCNICGWGYETLYVYSLVGVLFPGSSGGCGCFILLFLLWVCKPFSSLRPFSSSSIGNPVSNINLRASTSVFIRYWQSLSGDSYIRRLSASTCWHQQYCLGLVTVYGMYTQVGQSLDGLSFSLCSKIYGSLPLGILFPLLRKNKISTFWSSFFLSFMWSMNCTLGIPSFWANIHLSVSVYYVCSFMIGLPHSGFIF